MTIDCGTATAAPGERATGHLEVTGLPTGGAERLPVIVHNGVDPGPTVWVTAGVHGDEVTGVAAATDAVRGLGGDAPAGTDGDGDTGQATDTAGATGETRVSGAVVAVPVCNPAGLRRTTRTSYYHDDDPNRQFPAEPGTATAADGDAATSTRVQELIARRLYTAFTETCPADALLDLHTATVHSLPFVIRDRVLYGDRRDRAAASSLSASVGELVAALGLPVVREYGRERYLDDGLHRSLAGAALNTAGIPACTVELGGHSVVDEEPRRLGVAAVRRALVAWDVLPDGAADDEPALSAPVEGPVRRATEPRTDRAGIVRHRVQAGDVVAPDTPVAALTTPVGEVLAAVTAEHEGYVLGRAEGVAAYENDPVCHLAVRDEGPLVIARDGQDATDDDDESAARDDAEDERDAAP